MDFFKTVFSTDPEPSDPSTKSRSPSDSPRDRQDEGGEEEEEETTTENPRSPLFGGGGGGGGEEGGAWSFGGLIKTITSKSETVIQTYRRDLEEFSTGLKMETSVFKEVASRAVRDLPGSLEVGASVAQESLETVGQAIDEFGGTVWRGTAVIISQGKEALLSVDSDSNSPDPHSSEGNSQIFSTPRRYNRFEAQVLGIQNDPNTFIEEPEDGEDFGKWSSEFKLEEKEEEIEGLLYENGTLEGFFEKYVPQVVDGDTFWLRYFYRVHRLKQAEDARVKLVERVILGQEEEELSWEVDDDDDNNNKEETKLEVKETKEEKKEETKEEKKEEEKKEEGEKAVEREIIGSSESNEENKPVEEVGNDEIVEETVKTPETPKDEVALKEAAETSESAEEEKYTEATQAENVEEKIKSSGNDDSATKPEDKMPSEPKSEPGESGKDSDFSVVSSHPSMQEEDDLGWDDIEDLGEHEDKKADGSVGSPKRLDLRKRLTVAEDDEDLSWDIEEDDDEPAKP